MSFEPRATRLGEALGAEIEGIDLAAPLPDEAVRFIHDAWGDHLVVLFRDQHLEDEDLLRLAEALGGQQEAGSRGYYVAAGYRESSGRVSRHRGISIISNLDADGQPVRVNAGTGSLELEWHSDNSYTEVPPKGTMLYAHEVPVNGGGQTQFANQYLAWETLDEETRERLLDLHVVQDNTRNTAGQPRPNVKRPTRREEVSGPVHPIARVNPATGRTALYLGRRPPPPSSHVVELDDADSDALLDRLWAHATAPDLVWGHDWRPGDLVMWDNRCVLHRRTAIDPTQRRLMHRALIKGEPVVPAR